MVNLQYAGRLAKMRWYRGKVQMDLQRRRYNSSSEWNKVNIEVQMQFGCSLQELIEARPIFLTSLKAMCSTRSLSRDANKILEDCYDRFSNSSIGVGGRQASDRISAFDLIDKIGKICCPYCNIVEIENRRHIERRTSQIDHFYDKFTYPALSVSFFNLVPSCGPCNLAKGNNVIALNPYSEVRMLPLTEFSWKGKPDRPDEIELKFKAIGNMVSNNTILDIYGMHQNRREDLAATICKMYAFSPEKINDEFEKMGLTLNTKREVLELFFETRLKEDTLYQRRLSKMRFDILSKHYRFL